MALALLAVIGLLMATIVATAPVSAQHTSPGPAVEADFVAGNPGCPTGTVEVNFTAAEVLAGAEKDVVVNGVNANVDITASDAFSLSFDVDDAEAAHVFVKAGHGANHYDYTGLSGGGAQHDDDLISPDNGGGQQATISHVTFCLVGETTGGGATPTPTPTPGTSDEASLNILKVDEGDQPLAGAIFEIEGLDGTFTSGSDGKVCITGLPEDSVWVVTEIQAPAGYEIADPASQTVEVDDDGDCDSPDAVFVNAAQAAATATPTPTPAPTEAEATPTPTPTEAEATPTPTPAGEAGGTPTPAGEGVLGGNPTPRPAGQLPDTAITGSWNQVPATVLSLVLLGSLAAMLYVRLARER